MAKLHFYFAASNAGKSTVLLQASYNYRERGMRTLLFTPVIDARYGTGRIESRIGLRSSAISLVGSDDILARVRTEHVAQTVSCVLVDEAQLLAPEQVWQLADVVDLLELPVSCYGLRTDSHGKTFPGSAALLGIADDLTELRAVCFCGRDATMNLRVDSKGSVVRDGGPTSADVDQRYLAMCRRHFKEALAGQPLAAPLPFPHSAPPFNKAAAS